MSKIVHMPSKSNDVDVIKIKKDKIMINDIECEAMDLDEFIAKLDISKEAEERFVKGLLETIKEECMSNWKVAKMFREVFNAKK